MPSINKTANYSLNQWQGNEYLKREDLVSDNLIIDTKLKENADAINEHSNENATFISNYNSKNDDIQFLNVRGVRYNG
ncbi:MAG: hypothetical protein AB6733_10715 [Clostridiaceae bacterium]